MAHVISAVRMAPPAFYTPKAGTRTHGANTTTTPSDTTSDFQAVLKNQSTPAPAAAAGTMGCVTPAGPFVPTAVAQPEIPPMNTFVPSGQTQGTGPVRDANNKPVGTTYNNAYFADDASAARLAAQYGGVVYKAPLREAGGGTPGSPFSVPDANYIKFPSGAIVNAGTIASWQNIGRNDLIANEIQAPAPNSQTSGWYANFPGPTLT